MDQNQAGDGQVAQSQGSTPSTQSTQQQAPNFQQQTFNQQNSQGQNNMANINYEPDYTMNLSHFEILKEEPAFKDTYKNAIDSFTQMAKESNMPKEQYQSMVKKIANNITQAAQNEINSNREAVAKNKQSMDAIKASEGANFEAKFNVANAYIRDNHKELFDGLSLLGGENNPLYPAIVKMAMSLTKNHAGMHMSDGVATNGATNTAELEQQISEAAKKGDFKAMTGLIKSLHQK